MAAPALKLSLLASALCLGLALGRCPWGCRCDWRELSCDDAALGALPAGVNWTHVSKLSFSGNNLSALPDDAFGANPKMSAVVLDDNALSTLDLLVFARARRLAELRAARNQIESVLPARMAALETLDLSFNRLRALDPYVFEAVRSLLFLFLDGNPLVLPSDGPFLVHPSVASLTLGGVDGSALSPLTFIALPNLNTLKLNASDVRNLSRALAAASSLYRVELQNNAIEELPVDAFMFGVSLDILNLDDNPLEEIELAALSVLKNKTIFSIVDTTIACNCEYHDVWNWTQHHDVRLNATCASSPPCNFGK